MDETQEVWQELLNQVGHATSMRDEWRKVNSPDCPRVKITLDECGRLHLWPEGGGVLVLEPPMHSATYAGDIAPWCD